MSTASRFRSTLSLPDEGRDYADFPHRSLPARCPRWFRVHARNYSPWYFASARGRFDLPEPRGTLNTASAPEVAVRESLGSVLVGTRVIPESAVAGRRVSSLELPALRVADYNTGEAAAFGIVPGDVSAPQTTGYETTQAWATVMDSTGFDGIVARSRFGAGYNPECLFIFGKAGEHQPPGAEIIEIESQDLHQLALTMGFSVEPIPTSGELVIEDI